jgi:hypothetical protein
VDYDVVKNYVYLISVPESRKNADMLMVATRFFQRLVQQLKQTWIFYQLDTLTAFQRLLNEDACNNPLMRGLSDGRSELKSKRLEVATKALTDVITVIVRSFVEQTRLNAHLPVEALFRYQSKEIKDSILCNYQSGMNEVHHHDENVVFEDESLNEEQEAEPVIDTKNQWTQEQDDILIDNYQQFSSLPKKERFMMLAELVGGGKTYQEVHKRAKQLKVKKADREKSKAISGQLQANQQVSA